jgi:signal transduction histidine kinase
VVETLMERMRGLVETHATVVIIHEPETDDWRVAAAEGVRLPTRLSHSSLPSAAHRAIRQRRAVVVEDSWIEDPGGFSPRCRSAVYAPMTIRRDVTGIVGAEATVPDAFSPADCEWLEGIAAPAALAFANARLFRRLRAVGAEEERTRIARDLHDRVGQSLAYLAFELDRITARAKSQAVDDDLAQLRNDVRAVVSDVRETLYDIRSDVTDEHDVVEVLGQFLERVALRSGLEVSFRHDVTGERLPLRQEREMWRIAQEAVVNSERHAKASAVSVWWRSDPNGGVLDVSDDGTGFLPGVASRLDSFGMVGMRERATAIGARLEVDTAPGRGTTVRCVLDRQ